MSQPSAAVLAAADRHSTQPPSDKLDALQARAAEARDLQLSIDDLEAELKEKQTQLRLLYNDTIPSLMDEIGVDRIGVPPQGNKPGVDYKLATTYAANIAAGWPATKRGIAFAVLKRLEAEDLIKTEVTVRLPKGKLELAKKIVKAVEGMGAPAALKQSVHSQTLGAWLREIYIKHGQALSPADLDAIGGYVARTVHAEEREAP